MTAPPNSPPPANVATAVVAPPPIVPAAPAPAPIVTIYFASQSAEIPEQSKAELGRLAKALKGARQIELNAYAGGGDPIDDRKVALARALAVRAYLVDLGVTNSKIGVMRNDAVPHGDSGTEYVDILVPR
jgi:OmpA family protein